MQNNYLKINTIRSSSDTKYQVAFNTTDSILSQVYLSDMLTSETQAIEDMVELETHMDKLFEDYTTELTELMNTSADIESPMSDAIDILMSYNYINYSYLFAEDDEHLYLQLKLQPIFSVHEFIPYLFLSTELAHSLIGDDAVNNLIGFRDANDKKLEPLKKTLNSAFAQYFAGTPRKVKLVETDDTSDKPSSWIHYNLQNS